MTNALRTQMDNGGAKDRARATNSVMVFKVSFLFTGSLIEQFHSYWVHKLEQGTQFFSMSLSLDNTMKTYTVRFIGDYSATKIDDAHWNVSGTLETYSGATPNIMTESDLDTALGGGGGGSTSEEEFYNMPILVLKDATSGALTHTLPSTASSTNKAYTIKKTDATSNLVTVASASGDTIEGALTYPLPRQNDSITVTPDSSSNWVITSSNFSVNLANSVTFVNQTNYNFSGLENTVQFSAAGEMLDVYLPAVTSSEGTRFKLLKSDTTYNRVAIYPYGSTSNPDSTINGGTVFYLNVPNEQIDVLCDDGEWLIVSSNFDIFTVGEVTWFGSATLPNYVLELNGQYIDPDQYPRINALYGTTWGSSGGNIQLPDLRAYFPKGKESSESIGATLADMTAVNGVTMTASGSHIHALRSIDAVATSQTTSGSYELKVQDMKRPLNDTSSFLRTNYDSVISGGNHFHTLTGDSRTQPATAVGRWVIRI